MRVDRATQNQVAAPRTSLSMLLSFRNEASTPVFGLVPFMTGVTPYRLLTVNKANRSEQGKDMLAFVIEDSFARTERKAFLSPLATTSYREIRCNRLIPRDISLLMDLYDWNIFKATRECLMQTRESMAERLNIAEVTYAAIEDGLLTLCEWTAPAIHAALLDFFYEKTAGVSYRG